MLKLVTSSLKLGIERFPMAAPFAFGLLPLPTSTDNETFARLGDLQFHNRAHISTPHYIGLSSRGAIPHLSQDMMRENTFIKGVYTGLEDCVLIRSFPSLSSF